MGVLHCGLARGHRGNPVAGLSLLKKYGLPVLISGVPSLVLTQTELSVLHLQYKKSVRQILRLPVNTPECFLMLCAGSLHATAV